MCSVTEMQASGPLIATVPVCCSSGSCLLEYFRSLELPNRRSAARLGRIALRRTRPRQRPLVSCGARRARIRLSNGGRHGRAGVAARLDRACCLT